MNPRYRKTILLGVLFSSTLVIVAGLLKMLMNEWPLVLTTLGGFISLGVAFWASYVPRETNERWKRQIALAAAIGGLMSIGSGVLAHIQQLTKDKEQRQQTIQNEQLLRDSKEISEGNRQLSKENKELAEENKRIVSGE